jgi:hypothetical protein
MNQNEIFNDIFSECLDRLLKGETIEQCLHDFPEHAGELEPLLRTAMVARTASRLQPRADFKARARYEFQTALRDMERKKSRHKYWFPWRWQWRSSWAVTAVVVVIMVIGGGSTIAASSFSMPDDALYSLKLASEKVQLAVTPSEAGKTELYSLFAERRTDEIVYMASKGDAQNVQIVAQRLNDNLEHITNLLAVDSSTEDAVNKDIVPPDNETTPVLPEQNIQNSDEPTLGIASVPEDNTAPDAPKVEPFSAFAEPDSEPDMSAASQNEPDPEIAIFALPSAEDPGVSPIASPEPFTSPERSRSQQPGPRELQLNDVIPQKWEKIRQMLIANFYTRQARLEEALEKASPEVKPAIRHAIANSAAEYEKALSNLEQSYIHDSINSSK